MRDPGERWTGVTKARPVLDAFLDAELRPHGARRGQAGSRGIQPGHHDGASYRPAAKRAPAAILGYSGMLVGPEHLAEATARSPAGRPPAVLLVHGDRDEVIPIDALFDAAESLGKADIPTQWHLSFGIGHGIDGSGLNHGGQFLAQSFGRPTPR